MNPSFFVVFCCKTFIFPPRSNFQIKKCSFFPNLMSSSLYHETPQETYVTKNFLFASSIFGHPIATANFKLSSFSSLCLDSLLLYIHFISPRRRLVKQDTFRLFDQRRNNFIADLTLRCLIGSCKAGLLIPSPWDLPLCLFSSSPCTGPVDYLDQVCSFNQYMETSD